MANQPRQKFRTNVRYTWRPELAVSWAVIRLNEDGSETHLGSQKYKEAATRWATMLDKATQDDLSKQPQKRGSGENRRSKQTRPSAAEVAELVERPDQQIAFPWRLFSRRPG
jgi:hypothetical protein